jgi:hypothetical protein
MADTESEAKRPSRAYFTHITVNGCNLLGLANVFVFIVLFITIAKTVPAGQVLGVVLMGLTACGCCVFDLTLRVQTGSGGRLNRLLSSHAGGALVFIPVWAVYPTMAVIGLVMILHRN